MEEKTSFGENAFSLQKKTLDDQFSGNSGQVSDFLSCAICFFLADLIQSAFAASIDPSPLFALIALENTRKTIPVFTAITGQLSTNSPLPSVSFFTILPYGGQEHMPPK